MGSTRRVTQGTVWAMTTEPLFQAVDCLQVPVPDLETALRFYRDHLGHALVWRTATAAGLQLGNTGTELVLQTARPELEPNLLVASADAAARRFAEADGSIEVAPFDLPVGRCAVVRDPWGNRLVLLDLTGGLLRTDAEGNVMD